ncbi:hypothetical protein TNCV_4972951 [Trichonephila clavipes]|nr:hypothetical protein TNCV_4972951 [Trichonephila clavipes]
MPLPAEQYGTFYKHRTGSYETDLRIGRRKFTISKKIVPRKVPSVTAMTGKWSWSRTCIVEPRVRNLVPLKTPIKAADSQ